MSKKYVKPETVDLETGEILTPKLNEVVTVLTPRQNGSVRIQQDFSNCPSMAEQHTAHLTNINYLMERYKPDELAMYIAARNQHRREIIGHDFSREPDLQEANNIIYQSKKAFEELPDEVRENFRNHLEFLKFVDNPANAEKLIKLGLATAKQIDKIKIPEDADPKTKMTTTPKKEEDKN